MPSNIKRAAIAMTGASMLAFGGVGIADAAKTTKRHSKRHSTAQNTSGRGAETELTGDTAQKAKDAALAATGGGTAWRASTEDPGENTGAAYEVHVTKTDGSEVEVLLASDFSVVKTQASPQGPGGGRHHCDGDGSNPAGAGSASSGSSTLQ